MAAPNSPEASIDSGHMVPSFAKLHGLDFVYFMRKYSITLGRSTKTCKVDLDLSEFGGDIAPRVSHHHARIFYDFVHRHFALEVIGKKGCRVGPFFYLPGTVPIKLNSQDLIEVAGRKFYFLLVRDFPATPTHGSATLAARGLATLAAHSPATLPARDAHAPLLPQSSSLILDHPGHSYADDYGRTNGENGVNQRRRFSGELNISSSYGINVDAAGAHDTDTDDQQLLEEERGVVSSIKALISDICTPGEWATMEILHSELLERFGNSWSSAMVSRYLRDDSVASTETEGRPWCGLLPLLRKHPEYFVMSTVTRGEVTSEYVSLVSLVSLGNGP